MIIRGMSFKFDFHGEFEYTFKTDLEYESATSV
jgi:hypothetical protein